MKILLIGECSNVHWTLAEGLRKLGNKVTVLSNGNGWRNYPRDISLTRGTTFFSGLLYVLKLCTILPRLRGYDVVQVKNPIFLVLKAKRILPIYKYLRKHNKSMFMGGYGDDWYWVDTCCNERPLRYSDFNIGSQLRTNKDAILQYREWIGTDKEILSKYVANDCDGIIPCLYEYWCCYNIRLPQKTRFIPLPIQLPKISTSIQKERKDGLIHFFVGIDKDRNEYKGTDIMLKALEAIKKNYLQQVNIIKAISVPYTEYQYLMDNCDVILDQLYSYTPSMNALLAMSKGIIVVGGGEPENYEIIHETELRPIINVEPNYDSVYKALEHLIQNPEQIPELKRQSIEYVRKHHDYIKVAKQYESFYKEILNNGSEKEI